MFVMTKEQVKEVLDRVLTWPPQRQEAAARVLREMEEQHANRARLTDEQVTEIETRRADFAAGRERYATDEELTALWKKCGV
jgi:GAF domain-containing protein